MISRQVVSQNLFLFLVALVRELEEDGVFEQGGEETFFLFDYDGVKGSVLAFQVKFILFLRIHLQFRDPVSARSPRFIT